MSLICGILSSSDPELASAAALESVLSASQHRARDSVAKFVDLEDGVALGYGHTATFGQNKDVLSWHHDENFVSAVDGDIYDAAKHLRGDGARFSSEHAGAVVSSYEAEPDAFPSFDGFFSLFLWDRRRKKLHISADALSRKIVYYFHDPESGLLVFSSELREVLAHFAVPRKLDPDAAALYMALETIPAPLSVIDGVRKLQPGECLSLGASGLTSKRYWRPEFESGPQELAFWVERTRTELVDSVQRVLGGASRAAVFLSGGLDSSCVLAAAKMTGLSDLLALTIAYKGHPNREVETAAAQQVGDILQVPQRTITVDPETDVTPELLSQLFSQVDEPYRETIRLINEHFLVRAATEAGFDSILTGAVAGNTSFVSRDLLKLDSGFQSRDLDEALEASFRLLGKFDVESIGSAVAGRLDTEVWRENAKANKDLLSGLQPLRAAELEFRLRGSTHWSYLFAQCLPPFQGAEERTPFMDTRMALLNISIPGKVTGLHSKRLERAALRGSFGDVFGPEFGRRKEWGYPRAPYPSWLPRIFRPTIESLAEDSVLKPEYLTHLEAAMGEETKKARTEVWRWFAFACWYQFQIRGVDPFATFT